MAETIGAPFVLATLARGVPRSRVVWRDALKAALRPVAAVYGLVVGTLLSGSFVVEVITAWPGLGRLMLDALRARDSIWWPAARAPARSSSPPGACCPTPRSRSSIRASAERLIRCGPSASSLLAVAIAAAVGAPGAGAPCRRHLVSRAAERAADASRTCADDDGAWHAPFIYPWALVNQLEQRYEQDRSDARAARVVHRRPAGAVVGRGARAAACCSARTATAATCSAGCCSAPASRWAWRAARPSARWCSARRSARSRATPAERPTMC